MSRKGKISLALIVLITLLVTIFIAFKYQYYKNNIIDNKNAKNELIKIMNQGSESLNLKDGLSFEWTEAYIFNPYTPDKEVKEEINKKWISPNTSFVSFLFNKNSNYLIQDTDKRIVFINNNKVIKDIIYNKQDFDILDNYFQKNDILILKNNSQYKVK